MKKLLCVLLVCIAGCGPSDDAFDQCADRCEESGADPDQCWLQCMCAVKGEGCGG